MPTLAESLFDGLRDKATAVTKQAGEAAGKAVEVAGGVADATLQRPFADEPGSRALFDKSIGYAVFDTRQVSYLIAAGYGRGVAMDRATGKRTT